MGRIRAGPLAGLGGSLTGVSSESISGGMGTNLDMEGVGNGKGKLEAGILADSVAIIDNPRDRGSLKDPGKLETQDSDCITSCFQFLSKKVDQHVRLEKRGGVNGPTGDVGRSVCNSGGENIGLETCLKPGSFADKGSWMIGKRDLIDCGENHLGVGKKLKGSGKLGGSNIARGVIDGSGGKGIEDAAVCSTGILVQSGNDSCLENIDDVSGDFAGMGSQHGSAIVEVDTNMVSMSMSDIVNKIGVCTSSLADWNRRHRLRLRREIEDCQ
ncbi:hypothetical protein EZV62_027920 [Acer yangbiense]|uniref:Uncharacterized protein n=1 Tax=Acer yangbiense TaxID=1000413 RepID=A0A5C7GQH3_9ROSI|nr:hypothetical protein EZV62_027920 [Acer yangbiense]